MKNILVPSCLDDRKNRAEKIVKYLKDDRTIDKDKIQLKTFIEKWDKELKQH